MKILYFFIIIISSIILADINVMKLFTLGKMNVSLLDLFYFIFIISAIRFFLKGDFAKIRNEGKIYVLFIFSIIFFIAVGYFSFGYRAIGEGRYFYWLFAFFLPFWIFPLEKEIEVKEILKVFEKTIYISAILGVILFVLEVIYGGRLFLSQQNKELVGLTDFRGVRYLGSEETYNITVFIVFLAARMLVAKKVKKIDLILILILTTIVIITRNRAAPVALISAFMIYLFLKGNIKALIILFTIILIPLLVILLVFPQFVESILLSFEGIFNIREDPTGNWRYFVQLTAIEEGLKRPYFGIGFGEYFNYFIPEFHGKIVELPPHNAFIHLFSKTGIFPVILAILSIINFSKISLKLSSIKNSNEKLLAFFITIFVISTSQIFYGMAYGFSIYFGLFMGFFVNIYYRLHLI